MQIYSTKEVLTCVKKITNDHYDSDLAERIGVCKQSLSQYKNKSSIDVQLRIISLLLDTIEKNSNKIMQSDTKKCADFRVG